MRMNWIHGVALTAVALAIGLLSSAASPAAAAGANGGGMIYFNYRGDLYTMNDDGSGISLVPLPQPHPGLANPSRDVHAGKRWFVDIQDMPPEFYPDFLPDETVPEMAVRRVFVARSDAGDLVDLVIPADLEPMSVKWGVGDRSLTWSGRRWDIHLDSGTYGSVLEGGLYQTEIIFNDATATLSIGASTLLFPLELVPSNANRREDYFIPGPDIAYFDWAPDGSRFAFDAVARNELRIGVVATGAVQAIFADPSRRIRYPLWSPAGNKIMFHYNTGSNQVMLINPDGSGLKKLASSSPNWTRTAAAWSPSGSHLLYQHWDHFFKDSYAVRVKATGSGATRITGKSLGSGLDTPQVIGWR